MNRHLTLVVRLGSITVGFYLVRPVESLINAVVKSYKTFKYSFLETWNSENPYTPKWYYKECIKLWKEDK